MLIVDGHGSHISIEFFEFCLSVNIIPCCLPTHSTYLLQPLDVGLFSPLQKGHGNRYIHLVRLGNDTIKRETSCLCL